MAQKNKLGKIMGTFGGKQPGAGRPKGSKSAKTKAIEELLSGHVDTAIACLVRMTKEGDVMAARDILDRVFGKAKQRINIGGDGEEALGLNITFNQAAPIREPRVTKSDG